VPNEWRMRLQNELEVVKRRNLYLAAEMLRLSGLFRAKGLMVIPYKGPLLALQAYGDFALRQFADLDFAVRQSDLPRAAEFSVQKDMKRSLGKLTRTKGCVLLEANTNSGERRGRRSLSCKQKQHFVTFRIPWI
jgi:hypothetical protein